MISTDDLQTLRGLVTVAMNQEHREAEARAGADFLSALRVDGPRAQPQLTAHTQVVLARVKDLRELSDRLSVLLDDQLVASDPDRKQYPAAHARVRERHMATGMEF